MAWIVFLIGSLAQFVLSLQSVKGDYPAYNFIEPDYSEPSSVDGNNFGHTEYDLLPPNQGGKSIFIQSYSE